MFGTTADFELAPRPKILLCPALQGGSTLGRCALGRALGLPAALCGSVPSCCRCRPGRAPGLAAAARAAAAVARRRLGSAAAAAMMPAVGTVWRPARSSSCGCLTVSLSLFSCSLYLVSQRYLHGIMDRQAHHRMLLPSLQSHPTRWLAPTSPATQCSTGWGSSAAPAPASRAAHPGRQREAVSTAVADMEEQQQREGAA